MNRKRILADYDKTMGPDGKAVYTYKGPYFSLDVPPGERRGFLLLCWLFPAFSLAVFILMGFLNTAGTRVIYVSLPYTFVFLPIILLFGDAYKIQRAGNRMKRETYERSYLQMKRVTLSGLILSCLALFCHGGYLLFGGGFRKPGEIWFFALSILQAVGFLLFFCRQRCIFRAVHR